MSSSGICRKDDDPLVGVCPHVSFALWYAEDLCLGMVDHGVFILLITFA